MQHACNLIVDSCCDLPFSIIDRQGVDLVSFPYYVEGQEFADDLYQKISSHDFYETMRGGKTPTTAQVTLATYRAAFLKAIESKVPTVYLCFSSGLSGSYDMATLVRDQLLLEYPDAKLYVVDTLLASAAEALLVYEALCQRDRGMSAIELVNWAEEARYYVDAAFMVDDLESLRRGGRIPAGVAYAGAKLDVKPLLGMTDDGHLALFSVARGRKKALKQLAHYYQRRKADSRPGRCVIIGNADCPRDAGRLKEMLIKEDDTMVFLDSTIGPVIGSHVGPDMIAVVFWGHDKREDLSVADRIARKVKGEK